MGMDVEIITGRENPYMPDTDEYNEFDKKDTLLRFHFVGDWWVFVRQAEPNIAGLSEFFRNLEDCSPEFYPCSVAAPLLEDCVKDGLARKDAYIKAAFDDPDNGEPRNDQTYAKLGEAYYTFYDWIAHFEVAAKVCRENPNARFSVW
jgi:hypothetical protein